MATRLEASKKAHRRQMTKLFTRAQDFQDSLQNQFTDGVCDSLSTTITAITEKATLLQKLDSDLLEKTEDSKIEDFIVESDDYLQKINTEKAQLEGALQRIISQHKPPTQSHSTSQPSHSHKGPVHLPKLSLPTFSGDVLQWQAFIDGFDAAIGKNTGLDDVLKFQYLRSQLSGEASQVIAGLPLTSPNYHHAITLLKDRFGQNHNVVKAYMKALWDIKPPKHNDITSLKIFYDTLEAYVRGLASLGKSEDTYGDLLVPVLLEKLSPETRIQLVRDHDGRAEWTLKDLRQAISREITTLQVGITQTPHTPSAPSISSTAAFIAGIQPAQKPDTQSSPKSCVYCKEEHNSNQCSKVTDLNERLQIVKRDNRCYNCLGTHKKAACRSKFTCRKCHKRHHTSLCGSDLAKPKQNEPNTQDKCNNPSQQKNEKKSSLLTPVAQPVHASSMTASSTVLLKTAITQVSAADRTVSATIMFDEGATRSFLTQELASALQLTPTSNEGISLSTFGDTTTKSKSLNKVTLTLHTKAGPASISALVVPRISVPMKNLITTEVQNLPHIIGLDLAHPVTGDSSFDIQVLIGADYYWQFVGDTIIRGPGPTAVASSFGYLLSGPLYGTATYADNNVPIFHVNTTSNVAHDVQAYWDLETIGIRDDPTDNRYPDLSVNDYCADYIDLNDGQYVAKLPWKHNHPLLPTNFYVCNKRTRAMVRKLDLEQRLIYDQIIQEQLDKDFIAMVPDDDTSQGHYIPHHAVKKDSPTTPFRIVYDCSFKTRNNPSLNDCLESGPCLLNDLTSILLRFRTHTYGLTADIEKAFLQIRLHETDQDYTKFLWLSDPKDPDSTFTVYKFKAILFGATCSPFILNATITAHLELNNSSTAKDMKTNIYVDNLLTGASDETSVTQYYHSANKLMESAGFNLRQWSTNSPQLQEIVHAQTKANKDPDVNVLGMLWDTDKDVLEYRHEVHISQPDNMLTARNIVSQTGKVFDPLGYLSPVMVKAKVFIQGIAGHKHLDWDSPVPENLVPQWSDIQHEMDRTRDIKIPRQFVPMTESHYELHTFSDASPQAYGAAVYIRCGDNATLAMAKTRVKPLKKDISLPRMELLGVHIATLLTQHVHNAISSTVPISKCVLWTDSQICIHWVTGDKKLPTFIHNRVTKIRQFLGATNDIMYCPTRDNPADLLTRGVTVKQLAKSDLWWHGPDWLGTGNWPSCELNNCALHTLTEHELDPITPVNVNKTDTVPTDSMENVISLDRYSKYTKLLRITALVKRFITNLRSSHDHRVRGPITAAEIQQAELAWIKDIQTRHFHSELKSLQEAKKLGSLSRQLRLFIDTDNLLRVGGRLHNAPLDYAEKFPVLLPTRHKLTELLIKDVHHRVAHGGLNSTVTQIRRRFWIPKIRVVVKTALRNCVVCRKVISKPYSPPIPAPLQANRLLHAQPFTVTGIDFTGALYVKGEHGVETKVYVCLFTCAVTRAVHLELVRDMTTRTFLNAFRRFVSRRSLPTVIISDNATTYLAAADELRELMNSEEVANYLANHRIQWITIVKRASWYGGFYERLIGLTKTALKKVLGRAFVTYDELETVLCEVEAAINERPLTYVPTDCEDFPPLTPSQLVNGHSVTLLPHVSSEEYEDPSYNVNHTELNERASYISKLHDHFWQKWTHDYLAALREQDNISGKGSLSNSVHVGDIVLVHHDSKPRLHWQLARVTKLVQGNDGLVRSVEIRTSNGVTNRPISKLYPLEINAGFDDVNQGTAADQGSEPMNNNIVFDRPTRTAAIRARQRIKDWTAD